MHLNSVDNFFENITCRENVAWKMHKCKRNIARIYLVDEKESLIQLEPAPLRSYRGSPSWLIYCLGQVNYEGCPRSYSNFCRFSNDILLL